MDGSYKIYHDTGLQGWVGPYDIAEFTPAAGTEDLTKYLVDPAVRRAAAAAAAPRAPRARDDASPPPIPTEPAPRKTLRDIKLPSLFSSRKS